MVSAGKTSRLWRISLRPDAGVSDDRLVCHHPISQPFTTSDGLKIQVHLRHVLRTVVIVAPDAAALAAFVVALAVDATTVFAIAVA